MKKFVKLSWVIFTTLFILTGAFTLTSATVDAASTTKTTVKTSTRVKTQRKKLKKTIKKTKTTTKVSTKKNTKVKHKESNTAKQKITVKTTIRTTIKTTLKRRTKTIKTTVRTTTATTPKNQVKAAGSNGTQALEEPAARTSSIGKIKNWKADNINDLNGVIRSDIIYGFKKLGFKVTVDAKEAKAKGFAGCFSPSRKKIILKKGSTTTLLHEMGHFTSFLTLGTANSSEFKSIYKAEKAKAKKFYPLPSYTTATAGEYYAESFRMYYTDHAALKAKCPRTYRYLDHVINSINHDTVQHIRDVYGM